MCNSKYVLKETDKYIEVSVYAKNQLHFITQSNKTISLQSTIPFSVLGNVHTVKGIQFLEFTCKL